MKYRIKEILKEQEITMQDLADRMGCTRQNITKTLASDARIASLERIAEALSVPVAALFDEGDDTDGRIPEQIPKMGGKAVCPRCGAPLTIRVEVED